MSESSSNIVTVHTSKHSEPGKTFQVDLSKLCQIGPLYYSCSPQSQFYTSPQKRTLLEQIARFLTPENIQKYLIDFILHKKPCSPRRLYYCLTNFCKKYPDLTTYKVTQKDLQSGREFEETIVLWDEYRIQSRTKPRDLLDFFKRRRKRTSNQYWDVIICQVSPGYYIATAPVQIVCLEMIHSIQLLDQIPCFLKELIQDHRETEKRQKQIRELCKKRKQPYVRRALNPTCKPMSFPLQSFT